MSALYQDAKPTLETKGFPGEEGVVYSLCTTLIFSRSDSHRISYMCAFPFTCCCNPGSDTPTHFLSTGKLAEIST